MKPAKVVGSSAVGERVLGWMITRHSALTVSGYGLTCCSHGYGYIPFIVFLVDRSLWIRSRAWERFFGYIVIGDFTPRSDSWLDNLSIAWRCL